MPKTLHARLSLGLLALLLVAGAVIVASTPVTTNLYLNEVNQSLNLDLAHNIAAMKKDLLVGPDGAVRADGLEPVFHWLMVINPNLELYLLDADGRILAFDAPPGAVVRDRVSLGPIRTFIEGDPTLPITGDDPRHVDRRKIFSAAPLPPGTGDAPRGYLYVVLASEQLTGVLDRLSGNHALRLAVWIVLGCLGLAALAGVVLFARLTRPLGRLDARMRDFEHDEALATAPTAAAPEGDEVARLERTFDDLVDRVRRQMEEIERMAGLRRELIANVSHDLRTPIATLRGYLETMKLKGDQIGDRERGAFLDIALRQAERLSGRVAELFELTKLEHREVPIVRESFSLAELIHDNIQRFRLTAAEHGVTLHVAVETERAVVEADIGLVERALENLIVNAIRYTPGGGTVTVRLAEQADGLAVEVADTGRGIPEDELPHIFDRFYTGRVSGTGKGTGLGLAITKRILDLHDSAIAVTSQVGEGTTFRFALARPAH